MIRVGAMILASALLMIVGCGDPISEQIPPCSTNKDCPATHVCRQETGQCSVLSDGEAYGTFQCVFGAPESQRTSIVTARMNGRTWSFFKVRCSVSETTGDLFATLFTLWEDNTSISSLSFTLGRPPGPSGLLQANLGPRNTSFENQTDFRDHPLGKGSGGIAAVSGNFTEGGVIDGVVDLALVGLCGTDEAGTAHTCPAGYECDYRYYRELDWTVKMGLGQCIKAVRNGDCGLHAECPVGFECMTGRCVTSCEPGTTPSDCPAGLQCVDFGAYRGACARTVTRGSACTSFELSDYVSGPFCSDEDECMDGVCKESCRYTDTCSAGYHCESVGDKKICERN